MEKMGIIRISFKQRDQYKDQGTFGDPEERRPT